MSAITTDLLLRAYAHGYFPMAETADSAALYWFDPPMRGILPFDAFHIPRKLRRVVRQRRFELRYDTAFTVVMEGCAEPTAERPQTWINREILRLYTLLFERGNAHSVECWREGRLVGGLYGVTLRGAFFGESMFSRETDASKVALVHLVALLRHGGFTLLDTQFTTPHLSRFGGREIPQSRYKKLLAAAMRANGRWLPGEQETALAVLLAESAAADPP